MQAAVGGAAEGRSVRREEARRVRRSEGEREESALRECLDRRGCSLTAKGIRQETIYRRRELRSLNELFLNWNTS